MPICSASLLVTMLGVNALRCLSKRVASVNGLFRDVPSELIDKFSHLMRLSWKPVDAVRFDRLRRIIEKC